MAYKLTFPVNISPGTWKKEQIHFSLIYGGAHIFWNNPPTPCDFSIMITVENLTCGWLY